MTLVGIMRANRTGIPKELVDMQNRDNKDIKFVYAKEDDMMLTSYVVKKKSGNRNILLLSTMHDDVKCGRDEKKKPNTICSYDERWCSCCRYGNWQVHHQVQNQKVDNECLCLHARHFSHKCTHSFQVNQT